MDPTKSLRLHNLIEMYRLWTGVVTVVAILFFLLFVKMSPQPSEIGAYSAYGMITSLLVVYVGLPFLVMSFIILLCIALSSQKRYRVLPQYRWFLHLTTLIVTSGGIVIVFLWTKESMKLERLREIDRQERLIERNNKRKTP